MTRRLFGVAAGTVAGLMSMKFLHWNKARAGSSSDDFGFEIKGMDRVYKWLATLPPPQIWDSNWDHREVEIPHSPLQPRVHRHLYLVRHGQYEEWGEKKLTELGRRQAAATGARLKVLDGLVNFDYMVNSERPRAVETSEIIHTFLPRLERNCDELLGEGYPCMPDPPIRCRVHELHRDSARIEAAFRKYFHRPPEHQVKDTHELIVCHANVIRFFLCRALQLPVEGWLRFSLDHCSVTLISIDDRGEVVLRGFGESGHIPPSLLSRMNLRRPAPKPPSSN